MVAELGDEQVRRCSHNRSVHFPADALLISGYHEAPSNAFHLQRMNYRVLTFRLFVYLSFVTVFFVF